MDQPRIVDSEDYVLIEGSIILSSIRLTAMGFQRPGRVSARRNSLPVGFK